MTDNEALYHFNEYCRNCRDNAAKTGVKEEDILCDTCKVKNALVALEGNITVERLKELATKLGYKVIKSTNPPKLLDCICGSNRRWHWYSFETGECLECMNCGRKSPAGKNRRETAENWNAMIKELMKEGK